MSSNWLIDSFKSGMKSQSFKLDSEAIFTFKLTDNSYLMNMIKHEVKASESFKQSLEDYSNITKELKKIQLWLKMEDDSILKMSLLDVYTTFDRYLKDPQGEDYLFNVIDVSFIGPLGPFESMSIVECINDDLLGRYLFNQILTNKIPSRALRLCTDQDVAVTFGKEQKLRSELSLRQVTDSGLLFVTKDEFLINNMQNGNHMRFYLDTENLNTMRANSFKSSDQFEKNFFYTRDEIKGFQIEEAKVVKALSYKSSVTNEFHLFCRYHHMLESDIAGDFKNFIELVDRHFKAA